MIEGKYSFSGTTPLGVQTGALELRQKGKTLTGSFTALNASADFDQGSADGDTFSFSVSLETIFGEFQLDVSGKINGDSLSGNIKNPGFAFDISGVRVE
jgi:hypothetical protein